MNDLPSSLTDPYGERRELPLRRQLHLLGLPVEFRADDARLLALVDAAYLGLPGSARPADAAPDAVIELRLLPGEAATAPADAPPVPQMLGGAGLIGASVADGSLALVCTATRSGLVCLSPTMLGFPYHARYELLEFVVFTLASRLGRLVPLHAGSVSLAGRAALLVGESGAGKSTLSLLAMRAGLEFLTEDGAFVAPDGRVLGVPNFLHLRFDALRFLEDDWRQRAATSPVIRRRSGVEKYELDLRGDWARLAATPPQLAQLVFVTPRPADGGPLLRPLPADELLPRLRRSQPYAAHQPSWAGFEALLPGLQGWELRRSAHPQEAAFALHELLAGASLRR